MKKALILLAEGFEETEAIATHDVLARTHEIEVNYAAVGESMEVRSSMGSRLKADFVLGEKALSDFDFLVLPGGKLGVMNIRGSEKAIGAIKGFVDGGKPVYAICAAPSVLGELGYLDGKRYTCFPGFQVGKGTYVDEGVVTDGELITGRSMAFTIAFAEAIVRKQLGEEALARLAPGMRGIAKARQ
jgi:4-methyl-5(b-hydroxyethyl)-thiazole monophosphate biosynthesis